MNRLLKALRRLCAQRPLALPPERADHAGGLRRGSDFDLQLRMVQSKRFTGLKLSAADRGRLKRMQSGRVRMSPRTWRRIRVLFLLDEGFSVRSAATAVGGYPREVSRVGKRYVARGLEAALSDEPRPKPKRLLDDTQVAAVVAMVCGPAPEGQARWSVSLAAQEAVRRGITPRVGRERIRVVLAEHGLKPWREKNVVRSRNHRRVHHQDGGRTSAVRPSP